jgi:hypothetical protein
MATAHDAAKAVIAYLKSLDDTRDISVEQVQPVKKAMSGQFIISLARTPIEPRSWKRLLLQEALDGKLEVKAMFDCVPLS